MLTKSPSGALNPYFYKNGYFHGIHYGSYKSDTKALLHMIDLEEEYIKKSPQTRRVLIDIYESDLTDEVVARLVEQIKNVKPKIVKLCFACNRMGLFKIKRAFKAAGLLKTMQIHFVTDQDTGKTWLVS